MAEQEAVDPLGPTVSEEREEPAVDPKANQTKHSPNRKPRKPRKPQKTLEELSKI
jgi:hypothetical protein